MSPLRYPGAKRQLIPFFRDLLLAQRFRVRTFVEPFAGGASVALHVAANDLADAVVIAEADPMLYAFWNVAAHHTRWLVDAMMNTPVTLDQWDTFRATRSKAQKDQALAALFLNRTSFSGVLHHRTGPIGGRSQVSAYKIDCRFPKDTIAARLRRVGQLAERGKIAGVWRGDFAGTVRRAVATYEPDGLMFYLDPPFYAKSQRLYQLSFQAREHARLASLLLSTPQRWVLSYDAHPAIIELYRPPTFPLPGGSQQLRPIARHRLHVIGLNYTASAGKARHNCDEIIVTNLTDLPDGYLRSPDLL